MTSDNLCKLTSSSPLRLRHSSPVLSLEEKSGEETSPSYGTSNARLSEEFIFVVVVDFVAAAVVVVVGV